ncbi:hypothetical protein [Celerinatantimonas sp. YJH-8]|uniref:hypothetical protein n=1 Tax=Celerinatantimonas sp. YJH-8 TaxID=3228714 RepID=UPI0038CA2F64
MRWLLMALAIIVLAGCTNGSIATRDTGVKDHSIKQDQKALTAFEDIPADADTKLDPEASIIISEGNDWIGRLALHNGKSPFKTFEYYRQNMPQLGWNLIASVKSQNAVLTYIKGQRVATVQITGSGFSSSDITITVSPSSAPGSTNSLVHP